MIQFDEKIGRKSLPPLCARKIDGGLLEEYFLPVSEVVDDALDLLACFYDRKGIAEYLLTDIPAKDYAKESQDDGNN